MRFSAVPFLLLALFLSAVLPVLAAGEVSDDELYDRVRIQIANDREIGGAKIDVKVSDGVVELTGTVRTEKQKTRAGRVVKKVKGVRDVVNNLRIAPA